MQSATAIANPNIALIKYWGDIDPKMHLPSNGSISMNLSSLQTRTSVEFNPQLTSDQLSINGEAQGRQALQRVRSLLNRVRLMAKIEHYAVVTSENNFPMGTGIASSASAFAALALAASTAAGLELDETELSRLARTGSGSACRSIPGGFVEWKAGGSDHDSYAQSLAPANHWKLTDCIAIVSQTHKQTISAEGHILAATSPLQAARVADTPRRLDLCRNAILKKDFQALAEITELDSDMMHSVMMTSSPALHYWQPATLMVMSAVREWRRRGTPVFYTIDAGPNVHVICPHEVIRKVVDKIKDIPGVENTLISEVGGPARLEYC